MGVTDLEVKIVDGVSRAMSGEKIKDIIKDYPSDQRLYFKRLIEIGSRIEWVNICLEELRSSISEEREIDYPQFIKVSY